MIKSAALISGTLLSLLAATAGHAQLGGLGGAVGGVTGSVGGLGGTVGGQLGGSRGLDLDPGLSGTVRGQVGGNVRTPRVRAPAVPAPPPVPEVPAVVVVQPDLGYLGGGDVVRRGRTRVMVEEGIAVLPAPEVGVYMDRQQDELRRDLSGSGVDVVRQGENIVLQLPSDVTFAFDRSDIRPRFFPVLNAVSRTLNAYPRTLVDVIGHADAVGSDAYNLALSQRRASSVAGYLVARRAESDRLFVEGVGESEPIASNETAQGRAENRRVEIILRPHRG